MSLKTLMNSTAHIDKVFLNLEHFAEELIRWPHGEESRTETVVGVFDELVAERELGGGEKQVRRAAFHCRLPIESCSVQDKWIRKGKMFATVTFAQDEEGMVVITLQRDGVIERKDFGQSLR